MKFFHPQVQIARETVLDAPDAYYLHIVTFCPRTGFRADGHEIDTAEVAQGLCKVRVKLRLDPALPDYAFITPVVHTLSLGSIDFPEGEGFFEVQVVGEIPVGQAPATRDTNPPPTSTQTGGTSTVGTTGSGGKTKPVAPDSLYSNF